MKVLRWGAARDGERELKKSWTAASASPTDHAARAPVVHVAASHEVRLRCSGDHVNQSQTVDVHPTNLNLVM